MSRFFIDRPIFAWVLSIVIVIAGLVVRRRAADRPVPADRAADDPGDRAAIPGASAKTVADTVGQPIEEQVNGVEGMIYMSSTCTNNGQYTLTVSFEVGTDIHTALMLVQTRVQLAMPQLPRACRSRASTCKMQSPNILLAVNLISPDGRYDPLYLSNYAQINIFDELSRLPGVGPGELPRASGSTACAPGSTRRSWPSLDLTASEVIDAIQRAERRGGRRQHRPAAGARGAELPAGAQHAGPADDARAVRRHHRQGRRGRPVSSACATSPDDRARRPELRPRSARSTHVKGDDGKHGRRYPSVALAVFAAAARPTRSTVGDGVKAKMEELKKQLPRGRRLPHRLRHHAVHRALGRRRVHHDLHRRRCW